MRSFVLESEDRTPLPSPLAGQFLVFKLQLDPNAPPVLRSYSMSGPPGAGTYRVSVKRAEGVGSRFFHDQIHVGDLLPVSAPRGSFTLAEGENPIVLLSAGIGATPVLSMLYSLVPNAKREVWWCYGARNSSEHPFAAEARKLLEDLPNSHSCIAYSHPGAADQPGKDYDASGHLTLSLLQSFHLPQSADFYLCGPPAFLTKLTTALQSWGIPNARIHSEIFGTESAVTPGIAATAPKTPHPPAGAPGTGPKIFFTRSGLSAPWDPTVSKSAGICGSLRCSGEVGVPLRRLSYLRVWADRRRSPLCS